MEDDNTIIIDSGPFEGFEAKVLEKKENEFIVEVEVFGRKTVVSITPPKVAASRRNHRDYLLWRTHRADEWWLQRCKDDEADAGVWQEFLIWNEKTQGDPDEWVEKGRKLREERLAELKKDLSVGDLWTAKARRADELKRQAHRDDFKKRFSIDDEANEKRRKLSFTKAMARYDEIKKSFEATFGLILPVQTAQFWAFWSSLNSLEKKAAGMVWRYPGGILDWFVPSFEKWQLKDGLDHRLHYRYKPAPPEFVCVMTGDSDGLNYGLWYEDPACEPLCVASFYARDDASVGFSGETILSAYRRSLERCYQDHEGDDDLSECERVDNLCLLDELRSALIFFEGADRQEVGASYEDCYYKNVEFPNRAFTLDGFGVATNKDIELHDVLPNRPQNGYDLYKTIINDEELVSKWIENARKALAARNPYPALVLGRDLHARWDKEEFQPIALELMTGAYEMLGRTSLAEIARVHHEHRDLKSVDVYVKG